MREILFRGKRVDNGKWIYGAFVPDLREVYFGDEIDGFIKPFGKTKEERLMVEVDRETVGQYTGLTDKNGKRIFENDICRFDNDEPDEAERYTNYVIQWDIVNCRFVVVTADNCEDVLDRFFSKKSEIIANIHDNPELVEGRRRRIEVEKR